MDDLAALRLQVEWGADEALDELPHDRFIIAGGPRQSDAAPEPPAVPIPARATSTIRVANSTQISTAPDLAALQQAINAYQTCPLRATASTTVTPSGNPSGGLILIAEAPNADDDRAGHAFSGPPGDTLDRILSSAGLSRANLLLTHLIPWRPPGGRPPNDAELAQCLPFVHRLLALTRPRHLMLLGSAPLRALTPATDSLRKARGKWTTVSIPGTEATLPALPVLPPELWLSSPGNKQATWADLLLLKEALAAT